MTTPSERHRHIAGTFTDRVHGVESPEGWDAPSPVAEWTARDVVGHLVEWLPGFVHGGAGVAIEAGPPVAEDPVGAWDHHVDAVQALLDDPEAATTTFRNPHIGELPLADAIDQFYTSDVFMHTWDLARATGQDDTLDPETCATMLAGMASFEDAIRQSGQYGPAVPVPADASVQDRLLAFIGRDPYWTSPA